MKQELKFTVVYTTQTTESTETWGISDLKKVLKYIENSGATIQSLHALEA